ncbi:MAG: OmpH family outer membrane protein [Pelolinea sp.]|nr:OmpH family outer membrane protein [Pelolinea sp.]
MENTIKTLALLKVTLDHHPNIQDYLDIFIPFLTALLKTRNITELKNIEKICSEFQKEYGLIIPHHPMLAIINKAIAFGYGTEVSKGEFVPVFDKINTDDFLKLTSEHEKKFQTLLAKYITFSSIKHGITLSEEEASNHFILLLDDHDLDIVFANDKGESILPPADKSMVDVNLAYDFVRTLYEQDLPTFQMVADIAFGHIIASTLLFSYDLPKSTNKARVNYYLDTGILFGLSGIDGDYEKTVYEEFVKLIKVNNGKVYVFNHTYDEFVNIVEACKYWIDSPSYDPYKANRTLVRFKSWGYHISDIDLFVAKFPKILNKYSIEKIDTPDPNVDNHHQMSDVDFQNTLIEIYKKNNPYFDEEQKEETIYLDVRSVSAIYKQRKGCYPRNIEECEFLFVTRNATLAYASKLFETNINPIDRFYIPTTVTDVFAGTIMWLNSPIKIDLQNISKKKLIANCYAALQPTKQLKKLYLVEVEKVEADKLLSGDEINLLKTSNVAEELLQGKTFGDPKKLTSQTPIEIMNEIKTREKTIARKELEATKENYEEKKKLEDIALAEKDEEIQRKQQEIDDRSSALDKAREEKRLLIASISKKVKKNANFVAWAMFAVFTIPVIILQLISSNVIKLSLNDSILNGGRIIFAIIILLNFLGNFNFMNIKDKAFNYLVKRELKSYGISFL